MATTVATPSAHPPGPPELLPGRPDAIVDLQTDDGVALVGGQWRYSDATVERVGFVELGSPDDPLGPGTVPNRTFDIAPHAEATDFDDSDWTPLAPADTMRRLANGIIPWAKGGAAFDYFFRPVKPQTDQGGEMIYWERPDGGRVFNAGTIGFGWALLADPKLQTLLRNVLARFGVRR